MAGQIHKMIGMLCLYLIHKIGMLCLYLILSLVLNKKVLTRHKNDWKKPEVENLMLD